MKRFPTYLLLPIVLLTLLLAQGCRKKEKESKAQSVAQRLENPHINAIPKNAGYVIRMNARNVAKKGNLKTINEMKAFQKIFVDYAEGIQYKAIIELMKEPEKYGFNGDNDIYIFADSEDSTKTYVGFTVQVSDSSKVVNFHNNLSSTTDLVQKEGFARGSNSIGYWGWSSNLFFYIANIENGEVNLEDVFKQSISQKEVITQNENFREFMKTDSDISMWISSTFLYLPFTRYTTRFEVEKNELLEWLQILFPEEDIELEKLFQDNYIHAYSHFENGRAVCNAKAFPNKQIERMIKKYDFWNPQGVAKETLDPFPSEGLYCVLYCSVDMDKIRQIANTLEKKYENSKFKSNFFLSLWRDKDGIKAAKAMGGDMALSLSGIQQYKYISFPTITLSVSMKDLNYFPDFAKAKVTSGKYIQKQGYYTFPTGFGGLEFHLKQNGNTLVITSNEKHIKEGVGKRLTQNSWGKAMISQSTGMFVNVNYDEYPSEYKTSIKEKDSVYLDNFLPDKWLITSKNYNFGEIEITLKERDENALSQFIKYSDTATYVTELADSLEKKFK